MNIQVNDIIRITDEPSSDLTFAKGRLAKVIKVVSCFVYVFVDLPHDAFAIRAILSQDIVEIVA